MKAVNRGTPQFNRTGLVFGACMATPFLFADVTGAAVDRYDWIATECAPKNYPMQIVSGWLFFAGEKDAGLYVPAGGTINKGWGKAVSAHIVGADTKPLPDRLDVTYFSYTENQFFQGSFKLPYERIAKLFKEGYYNIRDKERQTYDEIMVGVAPGGTVAVWLIGRTKVTEVFIGQAEKADVDWRRIADNPKYTREQFVDEELRETLASEVLKDIREKGVPGSLWKRYHTRYRWSLVFSMATPPQAVTYAHFLNGERDAFAYPIEAASAQHARAVPDEIHLPWVTAKGRSYSLELVFDEAETLAAFEKLGSRQQALELEIKIDEATNQLLVWLRNNQESLELKKISAKRYGG